LAFELGWTKWGLAFATAPADNPRHRLIQARDLDQLQQEIARAKKRFGLDDTAPVFCCYEAGRDGFWLHRWLTAQGYHNLVVDAASIEVNRRARRAKSDGLDAGSLVRMLLRYHGGERKLWSVVNPPTVADEERRQLHRDLQELKAQRAQHSNRIKGLLAGCGLDVEVDAGFPQRLEALRTWEDRPVPPQLQARLRREFERWRLVDRQVRDLENERFRRIRASEEDPAVAQVRKLLELGGIGAASAWLFVMEFFAWRQFANVKQLGALAGLTPTPYQSGESAREQGISKAGNSRLRCMAVEIAWCWLRHQPDSALSRWYQERFGRGNSRARKIGIVALARKVLVALWRYLKTGQVPSGAAVYEWRQKLPGSKREAVQA
jgi:transposase